MTNLNNFDMTLRKVIFKRKIRSSRPEPEETFLQFTVRLGSYLTRWISMSNMPVTLDGSFDLMLSVVFKGKDNVQNDKNPQMEKQKPLVQLSELKCYHCERKGHIAQTCLTKGKSKFSGAVPEYAYDHEQ